jgi:hypothetical protein
MNRAVACMAPPGLTTLLEAAAYGSPMIMLPAQHYGHLQNYRRIVGTDGADVFPDAVVPGSLELRDDDIGRLTGRVMASLGDARHGSDDEWDALVNRLASAMTTAQAQRERLARAQQAAVDGLVRGFGGVRQVADVIEGL